MINNLAFEIDPYFYTMGGGRYLKDDKAVTISFFCDRCRFDFDGEAVEDIRGVEKLWIRDCPNCKNKVWRIQSNSGDPYFRKSLKLERLRAQYAKDILQPGQAGYSELYGDPFKKFQEDMEKKERDEWEKKRKADVSIRTTSF